MSPARTMMIATDAAKIGRWMKKFTMRLEPGSFPRNFRRAHANALPSPGEAKVQRDQAALSGQTSTSNPLKYDELAQKTSYVVSSAPLEKMRQKGRCAPEKLKQAQDLFACHLLCEGAAGCKSSALRPMRAPFASRRLRGLLERGQALEFF